MNLKPINNFEELKQSIIKIIKGEGEIKAVPRSVELSGANKTTTVRYEAEVDKGQLNFSIVYPQDSPKDSEQIIGINLFLVKHPLVLDNQQPEAVSETKNTSTSTSDYSVNLTLNFAANKPSVGVSTLLLYSSTNSEDRDKLDSKYNAKPLAKPFSNRSSAISTTGYGEIPELLKNYPEEIIKQYSKIVGTGIQYGYKRGDNTVLTFLAGALGTRSSRR